MKASKKRFQSVVQMTRLLTEDPALAEDLEKEITQRRLVKRLLSLRAARDLSQKELAEKMACTQSRISKLESTVDDDLRLGDVKDYARAVGYQIRLSLVPEDSRPVDEVKYHAFRIKALMTQLAEQAQEDQGLAEGVSGFFGEALLSLIRLLQDAADKLPLQAEDSLPYFQVELIEEVPARRSPPRV